MNDRYSLTTPVLSEEIEGAQQESYRQEDENLQTAQVIPEAAELASKEKTRERKRNFMRKQRTLFYYLDTKTKIDKAIKIEWDAELGEHYVTENGQIRWLTSGAQLENLKRNTKRRQGRISKNSQLTETERVRKFLATGGEVYDKENGRKIDPSEYANIVRKEKRFFLAGRLLISAKSIKYSRKKDGVRGELFNNEQESASNKEVLPQDYHTNVQEDSALSFTRTPVPNEEKIRKYLARADTIYDKEWLIEIDKTTDISRFTVKGNRFFLNGRLLISGEALKKGTQWRFLDSKLPVPDGMEIKVKDINNHNYYYVIDSGIEHQVLTYGVLKSRIRRQSYYYQDTETKVDKDIEWDFDEFGTPYVMENGEVRSLISGAQLENFRRYGRYEPNKKRVEPIQLSNQLEMEWISPDYLTRNQALQEALLLDYFADNQAEALPEEVLPDYFAGNQGEALSEEVLPDYFADNQEDSLENASFWSRDGGFSPLLFTPAPSTILETDSNNKLDPNLIPDESDYNRSQNLEMDNMTKFTF